MGVPIIPTIGFILILLAVFGLFGYVMGSVVFEQTRTTEQQLDYDIRGFLVTGCGCVMMAIGILLI